MPTKEEIKLMEKLFKKPFSQIDEIDIPAYIRRREFNEEMNLIDELERAKEEKGAEIEEENWPELHGAHQNESGKWEV